MVDYINHLQGHTANDNLLAAKYISGVIPAHIDFHKYQAILPIPVYMVGSEESKYIIDDDADWCTYSYRLSLASGLPLMSSKMSRTPPVYTRMMLQFMAYDSLDQELRKRLNNKPILLALNKELIKLDSSPWIPRDDTGSQYYRNINRFADRNHLQVIDSMGNVLFYEWYPPTAKNK